MAKRHKMTRRGSKKSFVKNAVKVKPLNTVIPMRGGFRI